MAAARTMRTTRTITFQNQFRGSSLNHGICTIASILIGDMLLQGREKTVGSIQASIQIIYEHANTIYQRSMDAYQEITGMPGNDLGFAAQEFDYSTQGLEIVYRDLNERRHSVALHTALNAMDGIHGTSSAVITIAGFSFGIHTKNYTQYVYDTHVGKLKRFAGFEDLVTVLRSDEFHNIYGTWELMGDAARSSAVIIYSIDGEHGEHGEREEKDNVGKQDRLARERADLIKKYGEQDRLARERADLIEEYGEQDRLSRERADLIKKFGREDELARHW